MALHLQIDALTEGLRDAGCDDATLRQAAALAQQEDGEGLLHLLCGQRCRLLDAVHGEQKKLDTLDYVLFCLKRQLPR